MEHNLIHHSTGNSTTNLPHSDIQLVPRRRLCRIRQPWWLPLLEILHLITGTLIPPQVFLIFLTFIGSTCIQCCRRGIGYTGSLWNENRYFYTVQRLSTVTSIRGMPTVTVKWIWKIYSPLEFLSVIPVQADPLKFELGPQTCADWSRKFHGKYVCSDWLTRRMRIAMMVALVCNDVDVVNLNYGNHVPHYAHNDLMMPLGKSYRSCSGGKSGSIQLPAKWHRHIKYRLVSIGFRVECLRYCSHHSLWSQSHCPWKSWVFPLETDGSEQVEMICLVYIKILCRWLYWIRDGEKQ